MPRALFLTTYLVMYVFFVCVILKEVEGGVMLFPFPMLKWPS